MTDKRVAFSKGKMRQEKKEHVKNNKGINLIMLKVTFLGCAIQYKFNNMNQDYYVHYIS